MTQPTKVTKVYFVGTQVKLRDLQWREPQVSFTPKNRSALLSERSRSIIVASVILKIYEFRLFLDSSLNFLVEQAVERVTGQSFPRR